MILAPSYNGIYSSTVDTLLQKLQENFENTTAFNGKKITVDIHIDGDLVIC